MIVTRLSQRASMLGIAFLICSHMSIAQANRLSETGREAQKALIEYQTSMDGKKLDPGIAILQSAKRSDLTLGDQALFAQLIAARYQANSSTQTANTSDLKLFFELFLGFPSLSELGGRDERTLCSAASTLVLDYIDWATEQANESNGTEAEKIYYQSWEVADLLKKMNRWDNKYQSVDTVRMTALIGASYAASQMSNWKTTERYTLLAQSQFPEQSSIWSLLIESKIKLSQHSDAEKLLQEAKRKFPDENGWEFQEMNNYLQSKQWSKALKQVDRLIQLEPTNESLYTTKASLLEQEINGISPDKVTPAQRNRIERAYQEATQKFPQSEDAWYGYGTFFYNYYANLTSLSAQSASENPTLDRLLSEAGKMVIEKSTPAFKRVQQINPKDINSLIALKAIFEIQGNATELKRVSDRLKLIQEGKNPTSSLY